MDWKIILANIREAREQLEGLESQIASSNRPVETELELALRHTYHHVNMAWNVRHIETENYKKLTESDFKKWGKFPYGLDEL